MRISSDYLSYLKQMDQKKFKRLVWNFYKKEGRDLPWRNTTNPYHIWVSEVMLQQTQVARVLPKYKAFLKKFGTVGKLAQAPLSEALSCWQGLGYNRRAKLLHLGAKYVAEKHKGVFPKEDMESIPGVGPYTASAIKAFAFNIPSACIETNIRTVYTHHFFKDKSGVSDKEILEVVEKTLDRKNPREWYWALMDYGAHLKASGVQINKKSKHYTKQSVFKGSDREVRGAIIRALTQKKSVQTVFPERKEQVQKQIKNLLKEGFIQKSGRGYKLAS